MLTTELGYREVGLVFYCFPGTLYCDATAAKNHGVFGGWEELS